MVSEIRDVVEIVFLVLWSCFHAVDYGYGYRLSSYGFGLL